MADADPALGQVDGQEDIIGLGVLALEIIFDNEFEWPVFYLEAQSGCSKFVTVGGGCSVGARPVDIGEIVLDSAAQLD